MRAEEKTLFAPFIKWASSQTARQAFIVAPHFNIVLTLYNNTTLKLIGEKQERGGISRHRRGSRVKSFPTVYHSLPRIPEAVISAMGNDDDRQPKNEAYKATAAMDYAPQGVTATTPAFARSVGYVTD